VGGVVEGSRVGEWRGGAAPAAVREEEAGAHRGCLRAHAPRIWLPRHRLVLLLTHLPPPSPRSPHSPRPARWRRRGEERSRRPWPPPPHASISALSSLSASRDPPTRTDRERRGPGGGNRDEGADEERRGADGRGLLLLTHLSPSSPRSPQAATRPLAPIGRGEDPAAAIGMRAGGGDAAARPVASPFSLVVLLPA
uniref:Uncharacterized protein n=1 Tax=Aegilops tauschii subsp. strangulata TaxID=200361 RepID=A0A453AX42_AEGTS